MFIATVLKTIFLNKEEISNPSLIAFKYSESCSFVISFINQLPGFVFGNSNAVVGAGVVVVVNSN